MKYGSWCWLQLGAFSLFGGSLLVLVVYLRLAFDLSAPASTCGRHLWHCKLPAEYRHLLTATIDASISTTPLFLLEPTFLLNIYKLHPARDKVRIKELMRRFDLQPDTWKWTNQRLTVGIFAEDVHETRLDLAPFTETHRISGSNDPLTVNQTSGPLHVFYEFSQHQRQTLHLHLVVLHRVKHFLWIGALPNETNSTALKAQSLSFAFSYEQIFDQFKVAIYDGLRVPNPNQVGHLLSQLPTSRYLHCDPGESTRWLVKYDFKPGDVFSWEKKAESVISAMKSLAEKFRFAFWITSTSLHGWYRQCGVTPNELTVFGTNYNPGPWQRKQIKGLEANLTTKIVFKAMSGPLCSVQLLGYKLLAPCDAQKDVKAEFGVNWERPVHSISTVYHYATPVVHLLPEFTVILRDAKQRFFLLEPYLLQVISGFTQTQIKDLQWRFNLSNRDFKWKSNSLTVGVLAKHFTDQLVLGDFIVRARILGSYGPYNSSVNSVTHVFYETGTSKTPLYLHLVVLYPIENYLWLGAIPAYHLAKLDAEHRTVHYGRTEEIYDPFEIQAIDGIGFPLDVGHFLSQFPTSRYLHCNPEKRTKWFADFNVSEVPAKVAISKVAYVSMKSLMRQLRRPFWITCGTLLGWFRQCDVTPYTDDTDFATWSQFAYEPEPKELKTQARHHGLRLYTRMGEPSHSLEYSFYTTSSVPGAGREKVDLFFAFPKVSFTFLPFHIPARHTWAYALYPKFTLCSVAMLGHKLLAPCNAEEMILTEYGPEWIRPVKRWGWYSSPHNLSPEMHFYFNVSQSEVF